MRFVISPNQTIEAAQRAGLSDEEIGFSGVAVLTFSSVTLERLREICGLVRTSWISPPHHPYATAEIAHRGSYHDLDILVLVPPMGASVLSSIIEDLAACGTQAVFLVCAAWSLDPSMQFGDLIVPTAARGYDGTSIHYGNREGHIAADSTIVEALIAACNERDARVHTGGVTSCEAIYRISESMMREAHKNGCVCMENGEAATTFAVTQHLGILGGVLFQPYIDLKQGWNPERLKQDEYLDTCRLQADVVLAASDRLAQQRTFKTTRHRQPFG